MDNLPRELLFEIVRQLPVSGHLRVIVRVNAGLRACVLASERIARMHVRYQLGLDGVSLLAETLFSLHRTASSDSMETLVEGMDEDVESDDDLDLTKRSFEARHFLEARFEDMKLEFNNLPTVYRFAVVAEAFRVLRVFPKDQLSQGWIMDHFQARDKEEAASMIACFASSHLFDFDSPDAQTACHVALFWCCAFDYSNALSLLLAHCGTNGNLDITQHDNRALRLAAFKGCSNVLATILAHPNSDPTAVNSSAIWFACEYGHIRVIQLLLNDARVDIEGLLGWVCEMGFAHALPLLLADPRVDPREDDDFAIKVSAQNGHVECLRVLLHDGRSDPAADEQFAVKFAAQHGHAECLQVLLRDHRVDPTVDNQSCISVAAELGMEECVNVLLEDPRVDGTAEGDTPIMLAAQNGYERIVHMLLVKCYKVTSQTLLTSVVNSISNMDAFCFLLSHVKRFPLS
ncbi:ankyrin repeat-containing domain protein [Chytriomyces sp. MP71]|nr:ankyrin repeat-containing domain protein [Chytriomyces sp. MP71]